VSSAVQEIAVAKMVLIRSDLTFKYTGNFDSSKIEVEGTIYHQTIFWLKVDNRTPTLDFYKIEVEGTIFDFDFFEKVRPFTPFDFWSGIDRCRAIELYAVVDAHH
jgi:hypothetical protein